jgi:hypothetical protein
MVEIKKYLKVNKMRKLKEKILLILFLIIMMNITSCYFDSSIINNENLKQKSFLGIGIGKNEKEALKNAKNDAIEQIIQSMGIDVEIYSNSENYNVTFADSTFSKSVKRIKLKFYTKAFLKIKTKQILIRKKRNDLYLAKVIVLFNKKYYQSTYRYYLKNYSSLIYYQNLDFAKFVSSMKLIDQIENKISELSGLEDFRNGNYMIQKKLIF